MPRDADIDKILRPSGKAPDPGKTAPSSDDDEGGVLDVGKGALKSIAGTAVALPRLANVGVGLFSSRWRNKLGDLAEQVPGVQSLESFADSPNKTWGESLGYWGGEGAQLFGPGWLGVAGKAAEAAQAAKPIEFGEMLAAGRGAAKPAAERGAAAAAPEAAPFVSTGNKDFDAMIKATREARKAGEGETGVGMGASRRALAGQQAAEEAGGLGLRPLDKDPVARQPVGLVGGALRGGVAGAAMDPQDPGSGFMSGAAFGGATPALSALARTRTGQYLSGLLARGVSAEIVFRIGEGMGIPRWAIMAMSMPHFIRSWHSPVGRSVDRFGRAVGRSLRGADRVPPRYPGGAAGMATQGIESDDGS